MLQQSRQKDKMRVVVRVRPLSSKENDEIQAYEDFLEGKKKNSKSKLTPQSISFFSKYRNANPRDVVRVEANSISVYDQEYKHSERKMRDFTFADVFGFQVSNQEIFEKTIKEGVNGVIDGYSCTALAYGITGSGKTFSVFGHPKIEKDRGLCFLAYEYLLSRKSELEKSNATVDIKFSFLQIYNENIRDLLSQDQKRQVLLGQDPKGNLQIIDAHEVQIRSIEQITELISSGSARRASAATNFNQISSRSHAILKMSVEVTRERQKTSSKLFIIDLAGSQKLNNQNSLRKTEGININKSLLTLGNCINALAENSKKPGLSHIPFRDSKLTRILKDSLGGNTKIIMIACISTYSFMLEETVTTLNYAERAQGIRKEITKNIVTSEYECPRCHCQLNNKLASNPEPSSMPIVPASEQIVEMETISNQLLERLYNDIIDNARQLQKLQRLKTIMSDPCEELEVVFNANQTQKTVLKETLLSLFQHKPVIRSEEEEEDGSKPQKKKIRLLNSSRKNSKEKDKAKEMDKENIIIPLRTEEKPTYPEEKPIYPMELSQFVPQTERIQSESKARLQDSEEKRMSSISLRRKRSKVEIVKKPPLHEAKRSCSERAITQF